MSHAVSHPSAAESVQVHMQAMHRKEMYPGAHTWLARYITAYRHTCARALLAHWTISTSGTHKSCRQTGSAKWARLWASRASSLLASLKQIQPFLLHELCPTLVGPWPLNYHPVPEVLPRQSLQMSQGEGSSSRKKRFSVQGDIQMQQLEGAWRELKTCDPQMCIWLTAKGG